MGSITDKIQDIIDEHGTWDLYTQSLLEPGQSYTGLGPSIYWNETTTLEKKIMTEEKELFRELLEQFKEWNDHWSHFQNNPQIEQPLNADEFAQHLTEVYSLKLK